MIKFLIEKIMRCVQEDHIATLVQRIFIPKILNHGRIFDTKKPFIDVFKMIQHDFND